LLGSRSNSTYSGGKIGYHYPESHWGGGDTTFKNMVFTGSEPEVSNRRIFVVT
jgi:hypothetical protein